MKSIEFCVFLLFIVIFTAAASRDRNNKKYKVVCYLGSWANYRHGDGKFVIEDIDPFLCTHAIYGFAKLENNRITVFDPYLDLKENWGLGAFQRFNNLKQRNPHLTTLIAIGGWNEGSTKYSQMAANPATRATFVKSVVDFCLKHNFDGLDMDWEYPANRGGVPEDKKNFILLLKDLKGAFQRHGLLLTAAVSAGKKTIDTAYDIPEVSKYLDFISVMAYDLHGAWETNVGHNSPLYVRPEESGEDVFLNVDYAINYWISKGAPRYKIILGMGLYGRSFTLADQSNPRIGAAANGPGKAGPITNEPGMLGYNEICVFLKKGWAEVFVPNIEAPYAYSGNQWVGYDNKKSIEIKVDYLIENKLGGGMVWSLETDDFKGKCNGERYPLLSTIFAKLNGPDFKKETTKQPEKLTTPEPTTKLTTPEPTAKLTTPQPTKPPTPRPGKLTTTQPVLKFKCLREGYYRDPQNCSAFYFCEKNGDRMREYTYKCADDAAFDQIRKVCTLKKNVPGC